MMFPSADSHAAKFNSLNSLPGVVLPDENFNFNKTGIGKRVGKSMFFKSPADTATP